MIDDRASTGPSTSLDGRRFVMESSTNSTVDPEAPSRFRYFERDGVVWGDYDGGTVTFGRFVGTRAGADVAVYFAHVLIEGERVVAGTSASLVEQGESGLRLVERFTVDGVEHVSVCVEEAAA